jgi:Skp family chaperone for outer membrane proteins
VTIRKSMHWLSRAAVAAVVAVAAAGSALAQQPAPARPAAGGNVPDGRIAVIYVAAFPEKVAELKRAIDGLNTRFEPRTKDLQQLRDQIAGIEAQVKQGTVAPAQQAQLSERYEQLKRDYERKTEDLKVEAQNAYESSTGPIQTKLRAALDRYAAEKGVVLIIEIGGALNIGSIFFAAEGTNITDDFINAYNKANP